MTAHRLDPPHLHHAALRLGGIVARGEMADADAVEVVASWAAKASGVDLRGLRMRLVHRMRDQARAVQLARENAEMAVRWAVRPLFAAGASAAAIEEAAGRAAGDVLAWDEVAVVLRDELARARGRRRA